MKRAAKIIFSDNGGNYLIVFRSKHLAFPFDPDLPGGIVEKGESPILGLLREVSEETGIKLNIKDIEKLCSSNKYYPGFTHYLYKAVFETEPAILLSAEHSHYLWLNYENFVSTVQTAADPYMHMVYDYLTGADSKLTRFR